MNLNTKFAPSCFSKCWLVTSAIFFSFLSVNSLSANTLTVEEKSAQVKYQQIAQGLGVIWAMDWISEEEIIFTVRDGKAGIFNLKNQTTLWLLGLPEVDNAGQGGLLDVAIPKDYSEKGWIYFTYSHAGFLSSQTALARAKLKGNELIGWQDLLITESSSIRNIHFGSRIAFDNKGHLFFSVGDRGMREKAQDLSNHAGTIMRLNMDGSVPKDNPFVGDAAALDEIWSYGHRNPQGLYFDAQTERLWSIEHGPRGGDEINLITKAGNYGWPLVSQGQEYFADIDVGVKHKQGMIDPKKVYIPSIAPSDLLLYRVSDNDLGFKAWQGSLLTGALKLRHLNRVELNERLDTKHEHRYLNELNKRIRSLLQHPDGSLFIGTDSGEIFHLTP